MLGLRLIAAGMVFSGLMGAAQAPKTVTPVAPPVTAVTNGPKSCADGYAGGRACNQFGGFDGLL
jgi:hypothetical protein